MSDVEAFGWFWLPDDPENKLPGLLTFSARDGGELRLLGAFERLDHLRGGAGLHRVLGEAGSQGFTLENCFQRRRTLGSQNEQVLFVNYLIRDLHYDPDEELRFARVTFRLTRLRGWLGMSGIEHASDASENNVQGYTVSVRKMPSIVAALNGGTLTVDHGIGVGMKDPGTSTVSQVFNVTIALDGPRPLSELLAVVSDFQDLVSVGASKSACFDHLLVSGYQTHEGPTERPVELLAQWQVVDDDGVQEDRFNPAFTFQDIGGVLSIEGWMRVAGRYRDELGRLMATRYDGRKMFASDVLFNRVAALEGIHREYAPPGTRFTFKERMNALAEVAGMPFRTFLGESEGDTRRTAAWCEITRQCRDDIAHHRRNATPMERGEHGILASAAYWLGIMVLMRECDFPRAAFDRLTSSPEFLDSAARAQALLEG